MSHIVDDGNGFYAVTFNSEYKVELEVAHNNLIGSDPRVFVTRKGQ